MLASVSFGLYLAVGFLAGWIAWPRLSLLPQSVLLLSFPVAAAGIYFSYTRSVWIGAAVGLLIALTMSLHGRIRKVAFGTVFAAGLFSAVSYSDGLGIDRRASAMRELPFMHGGFSDFWQSLQQQPMLGYGFGQSPDADGSSRPIAHYGRTQVSNSLANLLSETGVVGLGLFLAMVISWGRNAWLLNHGPRTPLWARQYSVLFISAFGVYFSLLLFHELAFSALENSLLFFLAGITVSLRQVTRSSPVLSTVMSPSVANTPAQPARHYLPLGA
jgi:hypothetical protein